MAKLLSTPRLSLTSIYSRRSLISSLSTSPSLHSLHVSLPSLRSNRVLFSVNNRHVHRSFSVSAFETQNDDAVSMPSKDDTKDEPAAEVNGNGSSVEYPIGEFEFEEYSAWNSFFVKCRMLFAFPWERVRKGSVLTMKLRGQISDQLYSSFSSDLCLPRICENFIKAAYDPRISGVYLHIESLSCGWGKVEEIRRHILDYRKSGKFIVGYTPVCGEKEYYIGCACQELYAPPSAYFSLYGLTVQASFLGGVFEKVGIEPQVQRIGKYKSAGDQLMRKNISDENREMLTALLDNVYGNWLDKVALAKGKKKEDIEHFINEGVYQVDRLKEENWITDIKYDDEVTLMLKERLEIPKDEVLPAVDYRKYSRVRRWTLGLTGYKDQIAVIRASGSISRTRGPFSSSSSGIIAEKLIEKIRSVRESKRFKAVVLRIDSPGGDALASDLMWREIRLLAESKPVIASMADVAASGGYYMAMAAQAIVAEHLTLTGSIGVVTVDVDGTKRAKAMIELHGKVKEKLEEAYAKAASKVNKGRKKLSLKNGDWVWVHLRKERFPTQRKGKMAPRGDGPFQVLKKINNNAYVIDLPGEYSVSNTFNVSDLTPCDIIELDSSVAEPFDGVDDAISRTKSSQEGEDDVNQPPLVPSRPFTRSQARALKDLHLAWKNHGVNQAFEVQNDRLNSQNCDSAITNAQPQFVEGVAQFQSKVAQFQSSEGRVGQRKLLFSNLDCGT